MEIPNAGGGLHAKRTQLSDWICRHWRRAVHFIGVGSAVGILVVFLGRRSDRSGDLVSALLWIGGEWTMRIYVFRLPRFLAGILRWLRGEA